MSDLRGVLALKQSVAVWSDRWQAKAARFVDDHRDLLPRRITNAQLYGLRNRVENARSCSDIRQFAQHQAEKAGRAGRTDVQEYWSDFMGVLDKLESEAQLLLNQEALRRQIDSQTALDALHRDLVGIYVQHLIAHSLYWTPAKEEASRANQATSG
jgi:hypothetical protein